MKTCHVVRVSELGNDEELTFQVDNVEEQLDDRGTNQLVLFRDDKVFARFSTFISWWTADASPDAE